MNPMYIYLEQLRRSGITNMYGAGPYLAREFGIGFDMANRAVARWMKSYNPSDYVDVEDARLCKRCGKRMDSGFYVAGDCYCSEHCLYSEYTEEEYEDLYDDGEAYWTNWED